MIYPDSLILEPLRHIILAQLYTKGTPTEVQRVRTAGLELRTELPYSALYNRLILQEHFISWGVTETYPDKGQVVVAVNLREHTNWLEVACTTIHEFGHVMVPREVEPLEHGPIWKEAVGRLGLLVDLDQNINRQCAFKYGHTKRCFTDLAIKQEVQLWVDQQVPFIFHDPKSD